MFITLIITYWLFDMAHNKQYNKKKVCGTVIIIIIIWAIFCLQVPNSLYLVRYCQKDHIIQTTYVRTYV